MTQDTSLLRGKVRVIGVLVLTDWGKRPLRPQDVIPAEPVPPSAGWTPAPGSRGDKLRGSDGVLGFFRSRVRKNGSVQEILSAFFLNLTKTVSLFLINKLAVCLILGTSSISSLLTSSLSVKKGKKSLSSWIDLLSDPLSLPYHHEMKIEGGQKRFFFGQRWPEL